MMRRFFYSLVFIGGLSVAAQESGSLPPPAPSGWTLESTIALAEQSSPTLRQAAAEIDAALGQAHQAGLYPNPVVSGGAMQLGGSDSQYYAQLAQEIVTKNKLGLDRAAATQAVRQAELRFLRARFDLLTAVRVNFVTALAAQRRVEVRSELLELVRRSKIAAEALEKAGEGSASDTLLLDIELDKTEAALNASQVVAAAAYRQLSAVVAVPQSVPGRVEGDLNLPLPDYVEDAIQKGLIDGNALVRAAEIEIERQKLLLRRAEVEPYPNVTLVGGYMRQVPAPHHQPMVYVELPLPLWNRNEGNIHMARARVGQAVEGVASTRNELLTRLAIEVGKFRAATEQARLYQERIMPKAHKSVELAQNAFKAGQGDALRVLAAQRFVIEADLDYLAIQEQRWQAAAEIAGILQVERFP